MKQQKGRKLFEDMIFCLMGQERDWEKIRFQLLKAWDLFYKRVNSFKNMDPKTQFYICETANGSGLGEGGDFNHKSLIE